MLLLVAISSACLGVGLGAALTLAHAKDINCSHVIEACSGSWGNDNIGGWENQNEMFADAGYGAVWGYGAFDSISGYHDADALFGGEGGDNVYGGYGNDNLYQHGGCCGYGSMAIPAG